MNKIAYISNYFFCFTLAALNIYLYRAHLFEILWPTGDTAFFFERYFNPDFIPNDFFTNASSESNPRYVFGYLIIFLTYVFSTNWYTVLCGVQFFFIISIPILFYTFIVLVLRQWSNRDGIVLYTLSFICVFIAMIRLSSIFEIAGWKAMRFIAIPENMSRYPGLISFIAYYQLNKNKAYVVAILIFLSTLVHPTVGLCSFAFLAILNFKSVTKLPIILSAISCFSALILILILFQVENTLSTKELFEYYVVFRHPHHYLVSEFAGWRGLWELSFSFISISMLCLGLFFMSKKDKDTAILSFLFTFSYISCVLIQYLFVELIPTRIFILLGIIRFSVFGYWMLSILFSIFILKYIATQKNINRLVDRLRFLSPLFLEQKYSFELSYVLIISFIISCTIIFFQPKLSYPLQERSLSIKKWVEQTPSNSTFAVPPDEHGLSLEIPLGMQRAIFVSGCFPFREDAIKEFYTRNALLYGKDKKVDYYRQLSPKDFLRISKTYPLDYVIIEQEYSQAFQDYAAHFADKGIKIYAVKDFED